MALGNSYSVNLDTGAIRYVSGSSSDTILDLHAYLQDLSDNATGLDNDNPSVLAGKRDATKPTVLTLPNNGPDATPFNIDDATSHYLKFGSVEQSGGNTLYSGMKTIGSIVAASPIYVVQNSVKLSTWWGTGHVQIVIKVKDGGSLIDSGNVTAYSRKYGQTFSHFDANLAAGSESAAAITTQVDGSIVSIAATAETNYGTMTVTVGASNHDLGNGNGSKGYTGTIDCGGKTAQEVYDALMWACSESSTAAIGTVDGWRFRALSGSYAENPQRPIVTLTSGTLYFERGWFVQNLAAGAGYSLIAADGTTQAPPVTTGWTQNNLVAGDGVLVAVATGGHINKSQFTVAAGGASIGGTSVTINEAIPADTKSAGTIRISGDRYRFSSFTGSIFTLATVSNGTVTTGDTLGITLTNSAAQFVTQSVSPGDIVRNTTSGATCAVKSITSEGVLVTEGLTGGTRQTWVISDAYTINKLGETYATNEGVYAPLIDAFATGTSVTASVTYATDRSLIIVVRNGNLATPIQPYITTATLSSTAGSNNTIRNSEV